MTKQTEEQNLATVLEAFDAAFNRRDPDAYERYWSPDYVQHSAHIPPGRDGLKGLIASMPPSLKYEHTIATATDDYVMIHGRFSGFQEVSWVVVDIVRLEGGILVEHWDVIQDEVTRSDSKSGAPMFGDAFPV